MLSETKWCVFTGAPSSGISTALGYLESWGFKVIPEAAREILDEWMKQGLDPKANRRKDEQRFQRLALDRKLALERLLQEDRVYLLDRGVPDSAPYYKACGLDPQEVLRVSRRNWYRRVFFLEPAPFRQDYARTESLEQRTALGDDLRNTYLGLGYEVISVPLASSKEERARFILSQIDRS